MIRLASIPGNDVSDLEADPWVGFEVFVLLLLLRFREADVRGYGWEFNFVHRRFSFTMVLRLSG